MPHTTITTKPEDSLREISIRKHDWKITEPEDGVYVITESDNENNPVRALAFNEITKFNDRVYYLKLNGKTVGRADTIGSTPSAYTPIVNIANKT